MPKVGDVFFDGEDQAYRCIASVDERGDQIVHLALMEPGVCNPRAGYYGSCTISALNIAVVSRKWRKVKHPEKSVVLARYLLSCGTAGLTMELYEKIKTEAQGTSTR